MAVVKRAKGTIEIDASDIVWIKQNITNINGNITMISNKVDNIGSDVSKLNTTVIGDEQYGQVGIVKKIKEHADYIEEEKKFKSKLIGGGIVVGALWTVLLKFWDRIF